MSADQPSERTGAKRGLVGRLLAGRYRVTRMVSAGASTVIADARDGELDRPVTIKLVRPEWAESPDFRQRFQTDMRIMSSLSHPNIAAVHDWGEEQIGRRTTVYAVVEYLAGGSLRDLFDRGRNLDPSQALLVGLEACRGLDFAHRKGLVHTELTPAKLVFGDDRRLRIVDFGLARLLGEGEWVEPARVATHVARYSSPEQALGQPVDATTDVYSLALILVEAVSGSVPFAARSTVATLSARIGRLMPVSADLGPLASVLERAGRPEPAERSTASELGRALVAVAQKLPRPKPLPILVARAFDDDPNQLRRPNDPTGGMRRPDEPATGVAPVVPVAAPVDDGPASSADLVDDALSDTDEVSPPEETTESTAMEEAIVEPAAVETPPSADGGPPPAGAVAPSPPVALPPAVPPPPPTPGRADPHVDAAPAPPSGATSMAPPGAGGAMDHPDVRSSSPAHVYDGDADATVDELAGLAHPAAVAVLVAAPAHEIGDSSLLALDQRGEHAVNLEDDGSAGSHPGATSAPPAVAWPTDLDASDRKDRQERPRRRWLAWLVALLVLGALGGLAYLASVLFRTPTHEMPELVGTEAGAARRLADEFNWEIEVQEIRSDEQPEAGSIVRTSPVAGEQLAEGEPFLVVVSEGPELRTLPDFDTRPLSEVETEIAELRLIALPPTDEFDEVVPPGDVISWSVPADRTVGVGDEVLPETEVALVVSSGPAPRAIPELVGLSVDEASARLRALQLQITVGEAVFDDVIPNDGVVTVDPPVGATVARGSSVHLVASKGVDAVPMPDLTGQNLATAQTTLANAGLTVGSLLGSTQGTFVSATVIGATASPGDQFERGTAIDMVFL